MRVDKKLWHGNPENRDDDAAPEIFISTRPKWRTTVSADGREMLEEVNLSTLEAYLKQGWSKGTPQHATLTEEDGEKHTFWRLEFRAKKKRKTLKATEAEVVMDLCRGDGNPRFYLYDCLPEFLGLLVSAASRAEVTKVGGDESQVYRGFQVRLDNGQEFSICGGRVLAANPAGAWMDGGRLAEKYLIECAAPYVPEESLRHVESIVKAA